jgi:hypothetical protein
METAMVMASKNTRRDLRPAPRMPGRNVWHLLPRAGIIGQARFEGTVEDERRLFYVAMTRSQKFLHLTWAPVPGKNNRYVAASDFWNNILAARGGSSAVSGFPTATPQQALFSLRFALSTATPPPYVAIGFSSNPLESLRCSGVAV